MIQQQDQATQADLQTARVAVHNVLVELRRSELMDKEQTRRARLQELQQSLPLEAGELERLKAYTPHTTLLSAVVEAATRFPRDRVAGYIRGPGSWSVLIE